MTITEKNEGNAAVYAFEGRLDTLTSPEAEKYFGNLGGNENIVFDFSGLSYISSAGLRFVLSVQKMLLKNGSLTILKPCDTVYEVFEITGFTSILKIER